jgi:hypothetical protein
LTPDFEDDEESIFETFSDTIFCVCVVLLALVAMLALNINEQLTYFKIEPKFYGGAQRPHLYLNLYPYKNSDLQLSDTQLDELFSKDRILHQVALFSPSAALAQTERDKRQMIRPGKGESHDSISSMTLTSFLNLAAGIDPGEIDIYDQASPFLLPINLEKDLLLPPTLLLEPASHDKFKKLLTMIWPIYENTVYPVRSYRDFKDARVKVYIETFEREGEPYLLIGHYALPANDIESGFLDFLISLSSSCTEIVYLGKYWEDPKNFTNRRTQFFEDNNYTETANAFKVHDFGWNENIKGFENKFKDHPAWAKAREMEDSHVLTNKVISMINEMRYSRYLESSANLSSIQTYLPPIAQYPDIWQQYVDACLEEPEFPPEWFLKLFLQKLGYNHFSLKVPEK